MNKRFLSFSATLSSAIKSTRAWFKGKRAVLVGKRLFGRLFPLALGRRIASYNG